MCCLFLIVAGVENSKLIAIDFILFMLVVVCRFLDIVFTSASEQDLKHITTKEWQDYEVLNTSFVHDGPILVFYQMDRWACAVAGSSQKTRSELFTLWLNIYYNRIMAHRHAEYNDSSICVYFSGIVYMAVRHNVTMSVCRYLYSNRVCDWPKATINY